MFPGDANHLESVLSSEDILKLYEIVSKGNESNTALRVLGRLLNEMKGAIVTRIAHTIPDAMEYAKLAGALSVIESLDKHLSLSAQEGIEAMDRIKEQEGGLQ